MPTQFGPLHCPFIKWSVSVILGLETSSDRSGPHNQNRSRPWWERVCDIRYLAHRGGESECGVGVGVDGCERHTAVRAPPQRCSERGKIAAGRPKGVTTPGRTRDLGAANQPQHGRVHQAAIHEVLRVRHLELAEGAQVGAVLRGRKRGEQLPRRCPAHHVTCLPLLRQDDTKAAGVRGCGPALCADVDRPARVNRLQTTAVAA